MKITKSRLLQIIKEEISRIEEVENDRFRAQLEENKEAEDEKELYKQYVTAWEAGDREKINSISNELYPIMYKNMLNRFRSRRKDFDPMRAEKFVQDALADAFTNPGKIDPNKSRPSNFLSNKAVWRSDDNTGSSASKSLTKTGDVTSVADASQKNTDDYFAFQRIPGPEELAMAKQQIELLSTDNSGLGLPPVLADAWYHLSNKSKETLKTLKDYYVEKIKELDGDDADTSDVWYDKRVRGGKKSASTLADTKKFGEFMVRKGVGSQSTASRRLAALEAELGSKALAALKAKGIQHPRSTFKEESDGGEPLEEISMPTAAGPAKYTDKTTNDKKPNPPTKSTLEKIIKEVLSEML